jgi:DNA primase
MNDLDEIIRAFDLATYLDVHFKNIRKVTSSSEEHRVCCFNCTDTKHHMYVNVVKKRWICFKCGYGDARQFPGTSWLPRFMSDVEGISIQEAINRLREHVVVHEQDLAEYLEAAFDDVPEKKKELRTISLPEDTFKPIRSDSRWGSKYKAYLTKRGMPSEMWEPYDLRYCVDHEFQINSVGKNPSWRRRIVVPVRDLQGNYRTAVARSIGTKGTPWSNWPDSDIADVLWPLGRVELGEWAPYEFGEKVVLVEGIFDAITVNHYVPGMRALCTFGKKIGRAQTSLLYDLGIDKITIAWDRDAKEQIRRAAIRLNKFGSVSVFPFLSKVWDSCDFGDVARVQGDLRDRAADLIKYELDHAVEMQTVDFISWAVG